MAAAYQGWAEAMKTVIYIYIIPSSRIESSQTSKVAGIGTTYLAKTWQICPAKYLLSIAFQVAQLTYAAGRKEGWLGVCSQVSAESAELGHPVGNEAAAGSHDCGVQICGAL